MKSTVKAASVKRKRNTCFDHGRHTGAHGAQQWRLANQISRFQKLDFLSFHLLEEERDHL